MDYWSHCKQLLLKVHQQAPRDPNSQGSYSITVVGFFVVDVNQGVLIFENELFT